MGQLVFKKIESDSQVISYIVHLLRSRLGKQEKVLWLISGGSAIKIAVGISQKLKNNPNLANLTVSLIDERYGPPSHPDSNWPQLEAAGFKLPKAKFYPILAGKDMSTTAKDFEEFLVKEFADSDFSTGLLGIGWGGHTSGILPNSPAVKAKGLVCAFKGKDFRRITTTPDALIRLDEAVVYTVGEAKWPEIDRLSHALPATEQPAQVLKQIKRVTIFNDYKEGSL